MTNTLLFVVSAPSGAGKTSLVKAMVDAKSDLKCAISHTTRPIRPGEIDGVNYHFVDSTKFEAIVREGGFLEHAKVFDHRYGTSKGAIDPQLAGGNDMILEIDWQGARQVRGAVRECIGIFILPPSLETLRERLTRRGEDPSEVIERRMQDAANELSHYDEYQYLVVNDNFDHAVLDLLAIVRAERLRIERQRRQLADVIPNTDRFC